MNRLEISFSKHAIRRFQERCRPALGTDAAGTELARIAGNGQVSASPPSWCVYGAATASEAYLSLGGDVVLPLVRTGSQWLAKTCLTRGTMSDAARARRNDRKARLRAARRTRHVRPRPRPRGYEAVA